MLAFFLGYIGMVGISGFRSCLLGRITFLCSFIEVLVSSSDGVRLEIDFL